MKTTTLMKSVLFSIALCALLSSCSKESMEAFVPSKQQTPASVQSQQNPVADFSLAVAFQNSNAPATIKFTNKSVDAVSYAWEFGDGSTSIEQNPSHLYTKAGSYSVTLTAKSGSVTSTKTLSVNIEVAYTSVMINRFSIASINEKEIFSGYFRIIDINGKELWRSEKVNVDPSITPSEWQVKEPYQFSDLSGVYYLELMKNSSIVKADKVTSTPFMPSLLIGGTNETNSYPYSTVGLNGFTLFLKWK